MKSQRLMHLVCSIVIVSTFMGILTGCVGTSNTMKLRKRRQITDAIIGAINEKDNDCIYALFSIDIKKKDENLKTQIDELIDYFDEVIVLFDYMGGGQSDQYNEEERYRQRIVADYQLKTESGKEYWLLYRANTIGIDKDSAGLYSIAVITGEDYNTYLEKYYVPMDGIVIVEKQREDELEKRFLMYE